jgi:LPS export ABC transporter protein LptC
MEKVKELTSKPELPIESGTNIEIVYSTNARVQLVLKAPKLDRYGGEKNYMEMPDGIEVLFFDSIMNVTGSIKAKYAKHLENEDIIELRDSVVVLTENNEEVNTEQLFWDRKKKVVYNEKPTKVITNEIVSLGEGFEADERFNEWSFKRPRGTMLVETQTTEGEEKIIGQEPQR